MKTKLIDTHAHLLKESYLDNLEEIINDSLENLELVINIAWSLETSKEVILLNKKYPNLYPVIGIHPNDVHLHDLEKTKKELINLIENNKVYGIGEIGIDLFKSNNLEEQIIFLKMQLDLSVKYNLPVIFHVRDAYKEMYEVLKNYPQIKALFHSWNSNFKDLNLFLNQNKNYYFGFNGIVTYKNKTEEVNESLEKINLDKIFIETDAPWLSPVPKRGKTNYPKYVYYILDYILEKRQINSKEEFIKQMNKNIKDFFNI